MFAKIIEELPVISMRELRLSGLFDGWNPLRIVTKGLTVNVIGYLDPIPGAFLKLEWKYYGESRYQFVPLERVNTNLGCSFYRWYFIDHERDIRFLKLYYDENVFKPRIDLKGFYYRDQIKPKTIREFTKSFLKPIVMSEKALNLKCKWRKTHYRGRPTPLMKKAMNYFGIKESPIISSYHL